MNRSSLALCALAFCAAPTLAQVAPSAPKVVAPITKSASVQTPDGKPIEGADVVAWTFLDGKQVARETRTDATGKFGIEVPLPIARGEEEPDKIGLQALIHAPGYALERVFLTEPGQTFTLSPQTATLGGSVADEKSAPIAGAGVKIKYLRLPPSAESSHPMLSFVNLEGLPATSPLVRAFSARSGPDGNWTLTDLPPGATASVALDDPRFQTQVENVILAPGATVKLVAKPGARALGRVIYPDGKPFAGAAVSAQVAGVKGYAAYASATSDAEGKFELYGLAPGKAVIQIAPPSFEWAPAGAQNVQIELASPTRLPDIKLGRGIALAGRVLDAQNKTPVAGARINAGGPFGFSASSVSDKDGNYTVRVVPGQTRFYIYQTPPDYVREDFAETTLAITAKSTSAPDFSIRKGVTLTGVAIDEDGQPAVGATISVGSPFDGTQTTVDANGQWTLRGVDPIERIPGPIPTGDPKITLKTQGEWEIVQGARIIARTLVPITLKMRRIALENVPVRVVTPDGKPLAGVEVLIEVTVDKRTGSRTSSPGISDANGVVVVPRMRPEQSAEIKPTLKGYALAQAGKVVSLAEAKGGARATDAILTPLNRALAGRVVDENGAPVEGALVAVLSSGDLRDQPNLARSDAKGNWKLENLRAGALTIGAARGRAWNQTAAQGETVTLQLSQSAPQPPARARDLARLMMLDWLAEAGERSAYETAQLAAQVAALDPSQLPLFQTVLPKKSAEVFAATLKKNQGNSDPALALENARAKLADAAPPNRDYATFQLIYLLLAGQTPAQTDEARQLYETVAARETPAPATARAAISAAYRDAGLMGIAGALGSADVVPWRAALERDLAQLDENEFTFRIAGYAESVARGDLPTALDWIATFAPENQVRALESIIPLVAKTDLPRAQQLLEGMEKLVADPNLKVEPPRDDAMYRPTPSRSLNVARIAIIEKLLPNNPRAAYAQAQKLVPDSYTTPNYVLRAAIQLPPDEALPALRAGFETAQADEWNAPAKIAQVAALTVPFDAALAEQWFGVARERMAKAFRDDDYRPSVAAYAFYRAPSAPAESRLLLENAWQRAYAAKNIRQLLELSWAMAPVDFERAREMLGQTQAFGGGGYEEVEKQRSLLTWLLASDAERQTLAFEFPRSSILGERG